MAKELCKSAYAALLVAGLSPLAVPDGAHDGPDERDGKCDGKSDEAGSPSHSKPAPARMEMHPVHLTVLSRLWHLRQYSEAMRYYGANAPRG